jgi:hypothetical protein
MNDLPRDPQAQDPLAIFSDLPAVEISAEEVEDMQRQVLALARWSDSVSGDDDQLFATRESRLEALLTRGRMFAAAAALVVGVGASALVLQLGSPGHDAAAEEAGALAQARLETELSELLAVLPLVEELDAAPNRVTYQLDEGDLDVVMIVDEGLDL